ncbi:hypothetical protein OIU76_028900 [Salix suchowensis]|nr:hypothetical protein OIU76_028900 [Salix suchowensis]
MTCRQVFCMLGISSRVLLSSEEVEDVEAVGEELTSIWPSVLGLGCGWGLLRLSFFKKSGSPPWSLVLSGFGLLLRPFQAPVRLMTSALVGLLVGWVVLGRLMGCKI